MIVAARLIRDRSRSTVWWALGLVGLVVFTVAFYPTVEGNRSFDDLVQDLPTSLQTLIGLSEGASISSAAGYLQARLFSTLLPLLFLAFAIGAGARIIGGSEEDGTLELLVAQPISRRAIAVQRYLAVLVLLLGLGLLVTASLLALAAPVEALNGVSLAGFFGACAGAVCLALLHGTVAFAVGAVSGRRSPAIAVATAVAVAGYALHSVTASTDAVHGARLLSPWHWYLGRNMLLHGPAIEAIVVPLVLSAAVLGIGMGAFERRDLR